MSLAISIGKARDRLARFDRERVVNTGASVNASVCILMCVDEVPSLLLTRRNRALRRHPGQWALPGGRCEPGEGAEETSRRETLEEVGIALCRDDCLGVLDDYCTQSGYCITPFVYISSYGALCAGRKFAAASDEVDLVWLPSLDEVNCDPEYVDYGDGAGLVARLRIGGTPIHAPTGAILHQFSELVLNGRSTRVDEFGEPMFARR